MMSYEISFDHLNILIYNNSYVKNSFSSKKRNKDSLSYLVSRTLSQSDCIKLGNAVEKILCEFILEFSNLFNIKQRNFKGKKEKDHLFCDYTNKIIYYAELKGNLNLDTEKSKSTYIKCLHIVNELKSMYPKYDIKWCLLGYRYITYNHMPNNIRRKYLLIKNNVIGINEYFDLLNIKFNFTNETFIEFLNNIANAMFP